MPGMGLAYLKEELLAKELLALNLERRGEGWSPLQAFIQPNKDPQTVGLLLQGHPIVMITMTVALVAAIVS